MKVRQRTWGDGRQAWVMDFAIDGIRRREVIPGVKTRKEALDFAQTRFADLKRREVLGELAGPTLEEKFLTLSDLLKADAKRSGIMDSTRRNEEKLRRQLEKGFGEKIRIISLSHAQVEKYKRVRKENGAGPVSINHELTLLAGALSRAAKAGKISRVPVKISKLPQPEPERRFLSREELIRVLPECRKLGIYDAVAVLANTGMRPCELKRLRWRDVDLERGAVTFQTTKRGSSGTIRRDTLPLNDPALEVFLRRSELMKEASRSGEVDLDGLVFPPPPKGKRPGRSPGTGSLEYLAGNQIGRRLKEAAKKAKIADSDSVVLYSLRHSFATLTLQGGASIRDVSALMRHRNPMMTLQVYSHAMDTTMRAAVDRLGITSPCRVEPVPNESAQNGHTDSEDSAESEAG